MPTLNCPHCSHAFDPTKVWTSPGKILKPNTGAANKVVVQCPKCGQWLAVHLDDQGNPVADKPPDKA